MGSSGVNGLRLENCIKYPPLQRVSDRKVVFTLYTFPLLGQPYVNGDKFILL